MAKKAVPTTSAPKTNQSKRETTSEEKVVCRNRKARHNYDILDTLEAGLALTGTEVKSLRVSQATLEEAFARVESGEVWLYKMEIPEYAMGNRMNHEPRRKRKVLLHRHQIRKFAAGAQEEGFTIIPLKLYFRGGWAKVELGIARGKKNYDKREALKERDVQREMQRATGRRRQNNY